METGKFMAVVAILIIAGSTFAADPEGFAALRFGTSRDAALKGLTTEYSMRRKLPLPRAPYVGRNGLMLATGETELRLSNYEYAGRMYSVTLFFNRNNRFYGYAMHGQAHARGKVTPALREEVLELARDFQQRYGPQGSKLKVDFRGVGERAETRMPVRDDEFYSVSISIAHRRGEWGNATGLVVEAAVCDQKLRMEPPVEGAEEPQASR